MYRIKRLDFNVAYACNLACKGCISLSDFNRKGVESLKDIEDDLYGFCETCGVEIGIKRLEARPTATQCIDCKTIEEIKEKQQYG